MYTHIMHTYIRVYTCTCNCSLKHIKSVPCSKVHAAFHQPPQLHKCKVASRADKSRPLPPATQATQENNFLQTQ